MISKQQLKIIDPLLYARIKASKDIYIPKGLRGKYEAVVSNQGVLLKKIKPAL